MFLKKIFGDMGYYSLKLFFIGDGFAHTNNNIEITNIKTEKGGNRR